MTSTPAQDRLLQIAVLVAMLGLLAGCGSSLSQPFDKMQDSQMTVYRLQNYEPPAPPPGMPAAGAAQLPPLLQQGAQLLNQLLPPGLLPPGLIPGTAPTPAPQNATVYRFHDFRILSYQQIADASLRKDIVNTFGSSSNFTQSHADCSFAEFGFAIADPSTGGTDDILVSFSCQDVRAFNFNWPYGPNIGIPPDTAKKLATIVQKAFGNG
jgi:hypothetical protein